MEIIVYVDGGCKNNQCSAKREAYGSYKILAKGKKWPDWILYAHETKDYGSATNNQAEYLAILDALGHISKYRSTKTIKIYTDSALVFNQIWGDWKTKEPKLIKLRDELLDLLHSYDYIDGIKVIAEWVPRETIVKELGH